MGTFTTDDGVIAAIDLDAGQAERTAREIRSAGGIATALVADVTCEEQVAAAVAAAAAEFGAPTVLHNNVGVATVGDVMELSRSTWDGAFAVNVSGVFLACKHTLPHMLEAGGGAIVNVSSVAGIRHTGYAYPAYMASKAAVNQLTVSLALTYAARGVRANAILPGLIDTPLVAQQLDAGEVSEVRLRRDAMSPTGRSGSPWDVANAAVFLASDEAAYINGVCLPVDGGLSARAC